MGVLEQQLVAHVARHGPIGFDEFQANALYAPGHGFYLQGGGAGRRRDFLTSPEVGPLFGAVLARALDAWWEELGRPDPYVVVEVGAGPGTLARTILAAAPECAEVLQLVLVEVGEGQWATHPAAATSRLHLPERGELAPGPIVVLANELLDNLPVALAERTADGWAEVVVDVADDRLVQGLGPLPPMQVAWCHERAPEAGVGARIPVQAEAAEWLAAARDLASGGRVLAFDYARATTAEVAALPMSDWLRTYAAHGRAGSPLDDPGSCDITCDVAIDQLALIAPPSTVRTQADFLKAHGIDDLVSEGRAMWSELGGLAGGLKAIAARSRVTESEALLDPTGLGSFTALEWTG